MLGCAVEHTGLLPVGGDVSDAADVTFNMDVGVDGSLVPDAASSDAASPDDAGSLGRDAGLTDAVRDAGARDAGARDAGNDAGPRDAGNDVGPAVDVCATGVDNDMDGVSDVCDRCAGEDDRIDVDGDSIPDACDPWPCSDVMTPPAVVSQEFIRISNVRLGEGSNRAVADLGSSVRLRFDYTLNDTGCVGCPNQIEVGSQRAGRIGCIFDGTTPAGGASDSIERFVTFRAPGVVELRFNLGRATSCAPVAEWWPLAPGPEHTFALICVR